jgi:predicted nuclease with TOPRIM domain
MEEFLARHNISESDLHQLVKDSVGLSPPVEDKEPELISGMDKILDHIKKLEEENKFLRMNQWKLKEENKQLKEENKQLKKKLEELDERLEQAEESLENAGYKWDEENEWYSCD